jgi:hypothetical protein
VNGYTVQCNPQAYRDAHPSLFPYNNPTSPTTRELPIGNFYMWIEKDGKVVDSRNVVITADDEIIFQRD